MSSVPPWWSFFSLPFANPNCQVLNAKCTTGTVAITTPSNSRRLRLIPCVLLALFAAQSLWFIATQSLTYDEPAHILAGSDAWRFGKFERWNDHPPLGRVWLTLPVARVPIDATVQFTARNFLVTRLVPGPEWLAWRTRPMNTLLGLALGVTLWFATRRLFSEGAANVALALYAFTPSLIAHFSVATTDGIGTLFIFLAAFQLVRWRRQPTTSQTVVMGLALGGLLLSKFYAPPLALLALVLMLIVSRDESRLVSRPLNWKPTLSALAIALLLLWAGYFFHVSHLEIGDGHVRASFPHRPARDWPSATRRHLSAFIPAGEYVEGLREVVRSNHSGRPAWFLGKLYPHGGIPAYYPAAIALKWPTVLLVLLIAGLCLRIWRKSHSPSDLLLLSLFPLVFFAFALDAKFNIGERHILPLYPFALLLAGGIWERARTSGMAKVIVILALCLNASDALRYAPDYLAYFNVFVRPQNSWRLLTDSNLDWGQGLIALRDYQQHHPNQAIHLAYFGSVDPSLYGIHATPLAPNDSTKGTVAISPTLLSGQTLNDPDAYHWLWSYEPDHVIDHSLLLYDGK
jgi:4-amino-4-deoxy-L-arabinose transferase-like glycosyltransferase